MWWNFQIEHKDCSSIEISFQKEKVWSLEEDVEHSVKMNYNALMKESFRVPGPSLSVLELQPTFFDGLLTNRPLIIEVIILWGQEGRGGRGQVMMQDQDHDQDQCSLN